MIFITGGTGFLGRELLARLLVLRPEERIALVVRPSGEQSPEFRVRQLLEGIFGPHVAAQHFARVEVIPGDVILSDFGCGRAAFDELAQRVSCIYHCAASTSLRQSLEAARSINVAGTEETVRFALRATELQGRKLPFFHVSTAFVAGDVERTVNPDELSLDRSFKNGYEQSKAEAERFVRDASDRLQTTIFRPSAIVGDSATGQTTAFHTIYIPARYMMAGMMAVIPAIPNAPFDIVPVDYVSDAIVELSRPELNSGGESYHLSVGVGRETSPLEILHCLLETFNCYRKNRRKGAMQAPPFLAPEMVRSIVQASLSVAETHVRTLEHVLERVPVLQKFPMLTRVLDLIPYMTRNPRFDVSQTNHALEGVLPAAPLFEDYADRVFRYCLDTNWGRRTWTNPAGFQGWLETTTAR